MQGGRWWRRWCERENGGMGDETRVYLDVLRWIFEGQEHVTIPATLRRSLSHLEKNYFTVSLFFLFLTSVFARASHVRTHGSDVSRSLSSSSPRRLGARMRGSERTQKGKSKETDVLPSSFPRFPPSLCIPHGTTTRTVTPLGAVWRGVARRGATQRGG